MEENLTDLLTFDFPIEEIKYGVAYSTDDGSIRAAGPISGLSGFSNIVEIDQETAEKLINGQILMTNCFVDLSSGSFEITEIKSLYKIDDLLHRIVQRKWSEVRKPDLVITYSVSENNFKVEITEEYGGTYIQSTEYQPVIKRKFFWDGETVMDFLITDYNDPHIIYDQFSIKLNDLIGNYVIIKNINVPKNFSIYTRRLFKNYILDTK